MIKLFYIVACIFVMSQVEAKQSVSPKDSTLNGIKFVKGLTWKEVLKKAKKENKYIFIDCYTTWCGPCRLMEKEVFPQKKVGEFYNQHFISIKCQFDRTDKDEDAVKNWYQDVDRLKMEYGMPAFPTYLYFSPEGKLVYRDAGYKKEDDLVDLAKKSMDPNGQRLYRQYYSMLAEYRRSKKDYNVMLRLIDTARILGQSDILKDLLKDYRGYLLKLPQEELYTKERISFISSEIQSSKDQFFLLFYPRGERVDSVMDKKGFAQLIVDDIIIKEDIYPYLHFEEQVHKNDLPLLVAESYPDWIGYLKKITNKYNSDFANRTVLRAEVRWYQSHHNYATCARYFTILVNNYLLDNYTEKMDLDLNTTIWQAIFQRSVDKEQIDAAIECMQGVVERQTARGGYAGLYLDTYANLLYKAGRRSEAIEKEVEAIQLAIDAGQPDSLIKELRDTLERMREEKPTWPRYIDKNDFFGNGLI